MILVFYGYTCVYYRADPSAFAALETDEEVVVSKTDQGWFFDGPSDEDLLVFYPGAKVEEVAYAPLLHRLAGKGMDVCLVKMPFRLAFFGLNKATAVFEKYDHKNKYVGGHSLGGAMAANYAASHGSLLQGAILLAAYPVKALDDDLMLLSIYGSEDGVLSMDKIKDGRQYAPEQYYEDVIEGGNHAYFGNYGEQKGDGESRISREEQQEQTVTYIKEKVQSRESGGQVP